MFNHKSNPPAGARPGTLAIAAGATPPKIRVWEYRPGGAHERAVADPDELARYRTQSEGVVWIDVQGLGDEAVLHRIGEIFEIHPLALEDAVNVPQRAAAKVYERQHVLIARMPSLASDGDVTVPQVCFMIGPHYLLTFQERYFGYFGPVRDRLRAGIGPIWSLGPDYLAYALLDAMIDRYYPIIDDIAGRLDAIEDEILESPHPDSLAAVYRLRRQIIVLRRVSWPQQEAIGTLMREASPFVTEQVRVFLRDTHDHIAQIVGRIDSARELAVSLSEIWVSQLGHRTNEIMKVLTLMASIFIPLTFIAGIYGMNFEYMPELQSHRGYFAVLGVMVALALAMIIYFYRRGWIGARRPPSSR
jgi:magnesium transporter